MDEYESLIKNRRKSGGLVKIGGIYQEMNDSRINRKEKEIQTAISLSPNVSSTAENICWLIASIACVYYSDFIRVLIWDARVYR